MEERQQCRHLKVLCQQTSELFNEVMKATCGKRKNVDGKKEREMKGIISRQNRGDRHHSEGQRKTKAWREGERGTHGVIDTEIEPVIVRNLESQESWPERVGRGSVRLLKSIQMCLSGFISRARRRLPLNPLPSLCVCAFTEQMRPASHLLLHLLQEEEEAEGRSSVCK